MAYFLPQLINGLTLGSIYGLIAIGYTMVYGIIGMINFAHGEISSRSSPFWCWVDRRYLCSARARFADNDVLYLDLRLDGGAYRPLRGSHRLAPLILAIDSRFFAELLANPAGRARQADAADHTRQVHGLRERLSYLQLLIIGHWR